MTTEMEETMAGEEGRDDDVTAKSDSEQEEGPLTCSDSQQSV